MRGSRRAAKRARLFAPLPHVSRRYAQTTLSAPLLAALRERSRAKTIVMRPAVAPATLVLRDRFERSDQQLREQDGWR